METPRRAAAMQGKTIYEGRPCRACGGILRYTSSDNCIPCSKTSSSKRHKEIRDLLAQARAKLAVKSA